MSGLDDLMIGCVCMCVCVDESTYELDYEV